MKTLSGSAEADGRRYGMLLSALSLTVAMVALPAVGSAELFTLQSGEVIKGDIVLATRNTITIRREIGGVRQVRTADLVEVHVIAPYGEKIAGRLLGWEDGVYRLAMDDRLVTVENGVIVADAALPQSQTPVPAAPPAAEPAPAIVVDVAPTDSAPSATDTVVVEVATAPGIGGPEVDLAAVDTETPTASPPETAAKPVEPAAEVLIVSVDAAAVPIAESGPEMVFSIKLSHPAEQSVVLIYATVDGTAIGGQDYESQQGVMTLEPGSTLAELRTPLINDQLAEGDEHFQLFLTADPDVATVNSNQIVATIIDDDK